MKTINVAVDGPSGSGKSTLSRNAAERLGYIYVDTGAMYRTIGLYVYRCGMDPKDARAVEPLLQKLRIDLQYRDGEQLIFLNGQDVSSDIRTHIISAYASDVAALPCVRAYLLDRQRSIARHNNVIMDGRDIATVVLPQADVKIFLTASPEIRAERRFKELTERGQKVDYETVLQDVRERDYQDSHRKLAPLKPSADSILLDTSALTFAQSLDKLIEIIKENL